MVHPLDTVGLQRRELKAREVWDAARRSGEKRLSQWVKALGWGMTRLDRMTGMRVMNLFFYHYGTVMAAGAAYMMFFSISAALVAGFSVAGIVIGGNQELQAQIVGWVDTALPGVIDTGDGGLATQEMLFRTQGFSFTLVVSLIVLVVTSLSWLHGLRSGIRRIWDRPLMDENVLVVKSRDLVFMLCLVLLLVISGGIALVTSTFMDRILDLSGFDLPWLRGTLSQVIALAVPFVLDVLLALILFRNVSRLVMPTSVLWRAVLIAGAATSILRVASASLLSGSTANPILAPFTAVLGLFFFFFLFSILLLVTASWAAVTAHDRQQRAQR